MPNHNNDGKQEADNSLPDDMVLLLCQIFQEMNAVRARDGVPYTYDGTKTSVDEDYWSELVDRTDEAVKAATGKSAHCHPCLYKHLSMKGSR